ncbi:MAG TPA: hypothetical protein PLP33_29225 [Leptospiraceae bacterium]|nr:hypothetical protein [Leptospiraceae bacterium]
MDKLFCENGCSSFLGKDRKFYHSSNCAGTDVSVWVDDEGNTTNVFTDGTVGVSPEVKDTLVDHHIDCLYCAFCHHNSIKSND